jgi:hypothetical protein
MLALKNQQAGLDIAKKSLPLQSQTGIKLTE